MPKTTCLNGRRQDIHSPADAAHVYDVINLWLDDEYGLREIRFPVRTLVDVGANIGLFSLWARHCFRDAVIHSYEPAADALPFAKRNLDGARVTLFEEGVAASRGFGEILHTGSSRLNTVSLRDGGDVPLVGMTDIVKRAGGTIDVLKLDCEGFEWEIFKDTAAFTQVRAIRMEYHLVGGRTVDDLKKAVNQLGFVISHLREDSGFGIAWLDRRAAGAGGQ
jgi:FkbM family methyltransferase